MMNRGRTARCCWLGCVAIFCFLSTEVLGDCGIPPSIDNTKLKPEYVDKETFPSGSVASYLCDNTKKYGKKPGLSDTITCEGSTWSTIPVFCELTCDLPSRFAYAALRNEFTEMNIYPVGISVLYQCRPGYKPIRGMPSSITCLESLTWSVVEPFCERISCGSPGEIINGNVHLEDNLFGSTATFSCNEGYQLIGRPTRQCINTGAWTNAVPTCHAVICASPANIEGGTHSGVGKYEFSYLSSITYRCTSDSLTLVGEASIHCTQYGNWSGIPPKCKGLSPSPSTEETQEGTQGETEDCRKIPGGITALCEVVDKKANESCVEAKIESYKTIMEMKKLCLEIQKLQLEISKLQS